MLQRLQESMHSPAGRELVAGAAAEVAGGSLDAHAAAARVLRALATDT